MERHENLYETYRTGDTGEIQSVVRHCGDHHNVTPYIYILTLFCAQSSASAGVPRPSLAASLGTLSLLLPARWGEPSVWVCAMLVGESQL